MSDCKPPRRSYTSAAPSLSDAAAEGLAANVRSFLAYRGIREGEFVELQALEVPGPNPRFTESRVAHAATVDDAVRLLEEADRWGAPAVYIVANRVDPAVATRAASGRWHPMKKGESTTDREIQCRALLYIDIDAARPKGTSSTDEQVQATHVVAEAIAARLGAILEGPGLGRGEEDPRSAEPSAIAIGHSGNGRSVFVALADLPETPALAATIKGVLAAVRELFEAPGVKVDASVAEAKRLLPAFGTMKRKGAPNIAERPHRRSAILAASAPRRLTSGELDLVLVALRAGLSTEAQLRVDAAMGVRPPARTASTSGATFAGPDVFRAAKEIQIGAVLGWLDLGDERAPICPGCGSTGDSSVAVVGNGLKCSHERCASLGVAGSPGFRTTIDLVCEVRAVEPKQAVELLADRFGTPRPGAREPAPVAAPTPRPAAKKISAKPSRGDAQIAKDLSSTGAGEPPEHLASVTAIRPELEPAGDWTDRLIVRFTKTGQVAVDVPANAIVALRFHPQWLGVVAFDQFQQAVVTTKPPPWGSSEAQPVVKPGPWTDGDSIRLQAWLRRETSMPITVGRDAVDSALIVASEANPIDPPRAYLESLEWDMLRRVGTVAAEGDPDGAPSWLTRYLGVPDSTYARLVGRWFLIASVARIMSPGCKVDNALVLEGAQGALKSTAAKVLYHPWYSDTPIDLTNKDRFGAIQGVWGYELAEFDAYSRHEASIVKAFVSSPSDKFRPPYLRRDVIAPRRCVFLATINPGKEYLQDETGGRRWWPVRVGTIDIEGLKRDRDVLWAEAVALYLAGEPWYPRAHDEHELCRGEQADRLARDAWEDPIRDWLAADLTRIEVTVGQLLAGPLGIDKARWEKTHQMRVAAILRGDGYERVRQRGHGAREYVYRRPGASPPTY